MGSKTTTANTAMSGFATQGKDEKDAEAGDSSTGTGGSSAISASDQSACNVQMEGVEPKGDANTHDNAATGQIKDNSQMNDLAAAMENDLGEDAASDGPGGVSLLSPHPPWSSNSYSPTHMHNTNPLDDDPSETSITLPTNSGAGPDLTVPAGANVDGEGSDTAHEVTALTGLDNFENFELSGVSYDIFDDHHMDGVHFPSWSLPVSHGVASNDDVPGHVNNGTAMAGSEQGHGIAELSGISDDVFEDGQSGDMDHIYENTGILPSYITEPEEGEYDNLPPGLDHDLQMPFGTLFAPTPEAMNVQQPDTVSAGTQVEPGTMTASFPAEFISMAAGDDAMIAFLDQYQRTYDICNFFNRWYANSITFEPSLRVKKPELSPSKWKRPQAVTREELNGEQYDIQGINWKEQSTTRATARKVRQKLYIGKPEEELDKVPNTENFYRFRRMICDAPVTLSHYQLRNVIAATSNTDLVYACNSKVMHTDALDGSRKCVMDLSHLSQFNEMQGTMVITSLAARDGIVIAGGLQGEYAVTNLHAQASPDSTSKIGIPFSRSASRPSQLAVGYVTRCANAITNHISIFPNRHSNIPQAAFCSNDQRVRIFDTGTSTFTDSFSYQYPVNCSATSPCSRLRLLVGDTCEASITDASSGQILVKLHNHRDHAFAAAWSDNGIHVATAAQDCRLMIYDARWWGRPLARYGPQLGCVRSLHFTPLGSGPPLLLAAEADDGMTAVDAQRFESGQVLDWFGGTAGVAVPPDGECVWVANCDAKFGGLSQYERVGFGKRLGVSCVPEWELDNDGWDDVADAKGGSKTGQRDTIGKRAKGRGNRRRHRKRFAFSDDNNNDYLTSSPSTPPSLPDLPSTLPAAYSYPPFTSSLSLPMAPPPTVPAETLIAALTSPFNPTDQPSLTSMIAALEEDFESTTSHFTSHNTATVGSNSLIVATNNTTSQPPQSSIYSHIDSLDNETDEGDIDDCYVDSNDDYGDGDDDDDDDDDDLASLKDGDVKDFIHYLRLVREKGKRKQKGIKNSNVKNDFVGTGESEIFDPYRRESSASRHRRWRRYDHFRDRSNNPNGGNGDAGDGVEDSSTDGDDAGYRDADGNGGISDNVDGNDLKDYYNTDPRITRPWRGRIRRGIGLGDVAL